LRPRVSLKGLDNDGEEVSIEYNLYDEYCKETNTSSMARTTGYTATAAVNIVLDKLFTQKGVFPPELVGKYEICYNYFIEYLKDRNIIYNCKLSKLANSINQKQSNNQYFHMV
jgi:lysine 6-dehydrogenase